MRRHIVCKIDWILIERGSIIQRCGLKIIETLDLKMEEDTLMIKAIVR